MRRTFSEMFVPTVLEEVGCSVAPWTNPDVNSLQGCVDSIYPGIDYTVVKGSPLEISVSQMLLCPSVPCVYPHAGKLPGHGLP